MEPDDDQDASASITCLPDEVLSLILKYNGYRDVINFALTCKNYYLLIKSDQYLWKEIFKRTLPYEFFEVVDENSDVNWLKELKSFFLLKKQVICELLAMSPKYYWRYNDISLEDVRPFFDIALSNNLSYHYTLFTLQDLIKKAFKNIEGPNFKAEKPFTLTEVHYAKIVLRHLIHSFLALKWVKCHINNELPPVTVVNYFLQWIDTDNIYSDDIINEKINELARKVQTIIEATHPSKSRPGSFAEKRTQGIITDRQVLYAVTQAVYYQRHMAVTSAANLDTLNIVKVLSNKCGNVIVVAAVYEAVARKFGIQCDLIAFPNHLFLEWRPDSDVDSETYTVNLNTGELHPKRRCPFSQNSRNTNYKYCPDSLLQYIYSAFQTTMGAIQNWNKQNAVRLLDFLGTTQSDYEVNPYRNFLPYLLDHANLPSLSVPLNIKCIRDVHLDMIRSLAYLNMPVESSSREMVVKKHKSGVKYAVGMICYHHKYDYTCVIRGWDDHCAADADWQRRMAIDELQLKGGQPFYNVVAADQSERYVAQENLVEIMQPTRLYHLEEMIARDFTHFDGFAYVPNDEKRMEYPEEEPIVSTFRTRAEIKNRSFTVTQQ